MIEPIERADDPRICEYAHVGDHDWLRAHGLFVAEGRLVLRRLLESGRFPVHSILLTPAALQDLGAAIDVEAPVFVAAAPVLNEITGIDFHRGCLALARRPDRDRTAARLTGARLLLALEGVGNPDNVGGLFRVAAAFGVEGVLLDPTTGDPFYRKAVRTSMGAVFKIPFERADPWPSGLDEYKRAGLTVVALTPRPVARPVAGLADGPDTPKILMVGAEGAGLTDRALDAADLLVRIPISPAVDSLNVVVAAGIALSYLRVRSDGDWL